MSATIDPTPATAAPVNGQAASPVDYIRALAPEEKEAVFIALLQELIEVNGGGHGLIPFQTPKRRASDMSSSWPNFLRRSGTAFPADSPPISIPTIPFRSKT
jgi:hypothetical protein